MAKTRQLTIASMAAPGWVRINEVSNLDMHFTALCGGRIQVKRSSDGKVFSWDTDTNHIRIYIKMEGPTDLPFITYASSGAGWFDLDGFGQIPLGKSAARDASGNLVEDVDAIAQIDMDSLEGVNKAPPI